MARLAVQSALACWTTPARPAFVICANPDNHYPQPAGATGRQRFVLEPTAPKRGTNTRRILIFPPAAGILPGVQRWAINSAGECYLHTVEVGSSNLPSPILFSKREPYVSAGALKRVCHRPVCFPGKTKHLRRSADTSLPAAGVLRQRRHPLRRRSAASARSPCHMLFRECCRRGGCAIADSQIADCCR